MVRNMSRITSPLKRTDIVCVDLPADDLAHELGSDKVSGIILIGAMIGYSDMMDPQIFMSSLEHKFAAKGAALVELNQAGPLQRHRTGKSGQMTENMCKGVVE